MEGSPGKKEAGLLPGFPEMLYGSETFTVWQAERAALAVSRRQAVLPGG